MDLCEGDLGTIPPGPCEWPMEVSCDDCWNGDGTEDNPGYPEDVKERARTLATNLLWRLTGRQYGTCCVTVRPCAGSCDDMAVSTWHGWSGSHSFRGYRYAARVDGEWRNCRGECPTDNCCSACEIILPGPVGAINEVVVDGIPLLDVEYVVYDHRRLVRQPWTDQGLPGTSFNPDTSNPPAGIFRYADYGMWGADVTGWGGSLELPMSNAAGDIASTQWPPAVSGARGQYVKIWVPPLRLVQITSPERGVTIWKTPDSHSNGIHDDAAGLYRGNSDGREYLIRFDEDQAVEWTADGPGVEIREIGFLTPGGTACWPECNDYDLDIDQPGTWAVSYQQGVEPPADAAYILGILAEEFAKACVNDKACRLPRNLQSLSRAGVSASFDTLRQDADIRAGRPFRVTTGLFEVDQWVQSLNPYGLWERSRAYSPESIKKAPRRETWRA